MDNVHYIKTFLDVFETGTDLFPQNEIFLIAFYTVTNIQFSQNWYPQANRCNWPHKIQKNHQLSKKNILLRPAAIVIPD